jgi:UDP-N-acetylmuramyl pentapeptide phosphotransferase/UDP-N-acetylglucosamine-1-phosphate transferase
MRAGRLTRIGYQDIMHAFSTITDLRISATSVINFGMDKDTPNPNNNGQKSKGTRSPMAGGIFIFIGLLAGSILGIAYDKPSVGMIGGFAVGTAIALMIWLLDSFRKQD